MDGRRFDNLTRALVGRPSRRGVLRGMFGSAAGGLLSLFGLRASSAQDDDDDDISIDVSAGNGGSASADASGGEVEIGDIVTGGNSGNTTIIGDTSGSGDVTVTVDGGDVSNSTDLSITANGGTAIADASGGDYNLVFMS